MLIGAAGIEILQHPVLCNEKAEEVRTMLTVKSVLVGSVAVLVLFIAMFLSTAFSAVSATRTTGRGALLGDLSHVASSAAFRVSAILIFLAVSILLGKHQLWKQS